LKAKPKMCIKKHLTTLGKALNRTYEPAKKLLEKGASLSGGEMHKSEKLKLFEKRLLELRQLSQTERAELLEALKNQKLLSFTQKAEADSEFSKKLLALEARISQLQEKNQRIRKSIHSLALLHSLLSHKKP